MVWDSGDSRWEYDYIAPNDDITDHTYTITVYDNSSNYDNNGIHNIDVFDDEDPMFSNINATPFSQIIDNYVNISATITDNIGIGTVKISIDGPGGFNPINVSMINSLDNEYYYYNNYSVLGSYNYSIWAMDTSGNAIVSADYHFEIIIKVVVSNLSQNWNFVSIPFNQSIDKSDLTVNNNGTDYNWSDAVNIGIVSEYIFGWNRDTQGYEFANTLDSGYGFWIFAYDVCELRAEGITINPDNYITNLKQSWNIIGIPDSSNVDKLDIIINYGGSNYNWSEAVSNGYVNQYVFGWNRVSQGYGFADIFLSGYGYWMYAFTSCKLYLS